jgi:hypothetical protein
MEKEVMHILLVRGEEVCTAVWLDHNIGHHGIDLEKAVVNLLVWAHLQEENGVGEALALRTRACSSASRWKLWAEGEDWWPPDAFRPYLACRVGVGPSTSPVR